MLQLYHNNNTNNNNGDNNINNSNDSNNNNNNKYNNNNNNIRRGINFLLPPPPLLPPFEFFKTSPVANVGDFLNKNIDIFNFSPSPSPPSPPLRPIQQFYQSQSPSQPPQVLTFKRKNDAATNTTQTLSSDRLIGELERVIEKEQPKENLVPDNPTIQQSLTLKILRKTTR